MIRPVLVARIRQRFSHRKRARVCLGFDPEGKFERLLCALAAKLQRMKTALFLLLACDPKQKHGQLCLRQRSSWRSS